MIIMINSLTLNSIILGSCFIIYWKYLWPRDKSYVVVYHKKQRNITTHILLFDNTFFYVLLVVHCKIQCWYYFSTMFCRINVYRIMDKHLLNWWPLFYNFNCFSKNKLCGSPLAQISHLGRQPLPDNIKMDPEWNKIEVKSH